MPFAMKLLADQHFLRDDAKIRPAEIVPALQPGTSKGDLRKFNPQG